MTPDVNVILLNFPNKGREIVVENEDGSYTILINSKLSHEGQLKAYEHAMHHIQESDFQKNDVQAIEAAAHGTDPLKNAPKLPAEQYLKRIKQLQKRQHQLQKR